MIKEVKKKFAAKAIESIKAKVNRERKRHFTPLESVKSVLVLYRLTDNTIPVEMFHLVGTLTRLGAKTDVIFTGKGVLPPAEVAENDTFHYVSPKDITWRGVPKNDKILGLLQKDYDYFIDLTDADHGQDAYIAASSMAKFKIGKTQYEGAPYDFSLVVSEDSDLGVFEEQLMVYLRRIS